MPIKTNTLTDGVKTYTLRWYDAHGKDCSKTFKRLTDARTFEKQQAKNRLEGVIFHSDDRAMLFSVFAERYLKELSLRIKPRTLDRYRSFLDKHILPCFENFRMSRIRHDDGISFIHELQEKQLSPKSINGALTLLKQITKHATEAHGDLKQLNADPLKNVKLLKLEAKKEELLFWEKKEVRDFIKKAKDDPYYDLYILILNTGLRIGEAAGLMCGKVNIQRQHALISQILNYKKQGKKTVFYIGATKTSEVRRIPLNDAALEILMRRMKGKKAGDLVFENHRGFIREVEIGGAIKKIAPIDTMHHNYEYFTPLQVKLGIKKIITIHNLRHTYASHYIMNGGQIYPLSKILGHKDITMTMRYAHLAQSYLQDSRALVQY